MWPKQVLLGLTFAAAGAVLLGQPALAETSVAQDQSSVLSPRGPDVVCSDGSVRVKPNPPVEFSPATASNADLNKYGYAPRPPDSDPTVLRAWKKYISSPIDWGSCPTAAQETQSQKDQLALQQYPPGANQQPGDSGAAAQTPSGGSCGYWSGYIPGSEVYTDAMGYMQVPPVSGLGGVVYAWIGVNSIGSATYPVIQAGIGANPAGDWYIWQESLGHNGATQVGKFTKMVHPNDWVFVHATLTLSGDAGFHVIDISDSPAIDWTSKPGAVPGGSLDWSADFVLEQPSCKFPIANFGTAVFSDAEVASQSKGWEYLAATTTHRRMIIADSSNNTVVQISPITANADFKATWERAS